MISFNSNLSEVLGKFGSEMKAMGPELELGLKSTVMGAARAMGVEAAALSSFSHKIPGTIRVNSLGEFGAVVRAGGDDGEAAAFEHGGVGGSFRHPVFGHRDRWVKQGAHPFMAPAFEHKSLSVEHEEARVVDGVFRRIGYV